MLMVICWHDQVAEKLELSRLCSQLRLDRWRSGSVLLSVWCHIFHIFILFVGEFHWLKWSSSVVLHNVPQQEGCECLPEEVCVRGASFRRELQCWCEFSSVQSLSCIWLCDPMKCSVPGFPVLHQLLGLAHTHVHWAGDAIQLSRPVIPFCCLQSFPSIRVFSSVQC